MTPHLTTMVANDVDSVVGSQLITNDKSLLSTFSIGDNLIVGSYDRRLCWFDMDLSTKPYKTLRLVHRYSLSEQPLTAFVKLSGKRDFANAEGCKTDKGEGDTLRRRGGGRVENNNPGLERRYVAKEGKRTPPRLLDDCL